MAPDKAIVISTHTLEEVPAMCNRVILVDRGQVVANETPASLAGRFAGGLEDAFTVLASGQEKVTQ